MEQQEVTISKAGVCANLPARTAVLAAANPVAGHYTRSKTIVENLKMSAALLSRFDVVFLLLDKPDEVLDERLSEHILAIHAGVQLATVISARDRADAFTEQHPSQLSCICLFQLQAPLLLTRLPDLTCLECFVNPADDISF